MQHLIGHVPVKRRSRFRETAVTLWCNDGHFPVNSAGADSLHVGPSSRAVRAGFPQTSFERQHRAWLIRCFCLSFGIKLALKLWMKKQRLYKSLQKPQEKL